MTAAFLDEGLESFEAVFETSFDDIHRYLARRVGQETADDLASEVFCRAFRLRSRFDPTKGTVQQWLYGIASNVLREDAYRAKRHRRFFQCSAATTTGAGDASRPADTMLELREALAALDPRDLDTLGLWAWEGLSYEEIAVVSSIPVGTVKSRISRARRILREQLGRPDNTRQQPTRHNPQR